MSDDFDREAEREKLREQFGEEEDREHAERLSELLLKGATMTNKHCDRCGDPVFRHDGREFCPTCQREVADEDASTATAGQAASQGLDTGADADAAGEDPSGADAGTDGNDDPVEVDVETPDPGMEAEAEGGDPSTADAPDAGATPTPDTTPPASARSPPSRAGAGAGGDAAGEQPTRMPAGRETAGDADGATEGLLPARRHLTRTVNRLAEQAAAETDPGRKREFLAATREAAEALAAVRSAE